MKNFCVCNEDGNCYVPVKNNLPQYAELAPYCDQYAGKINRLITWKKGN